MAVAGQSWCRMLCDPACRRVACREGACHSCSAARIGVLAGGLLAILQSTVVFCHNFSKCIFSSRTQEQADCASSEAERCCWGPGTGCRPYSVQTASQREAETEGLAGHTCSGVL